jgi:YfiH family protein
VIFEADLGEPYRVVFSSRLGGVSEGRYQSLNLGILTDDEPERVVENRRLLCGSVGIDPETATMAWQAHGAKVLRADGRGIVRPGTPLERCDGLWTDERERGLMLLTADCLPVALARANGRPGVAALHVGWRGLLGGIVEAGVEALGGRPLRAAIGPGIGPCCFEVGAEVVAQIPGADDASSIGPNGRPYVDLWELNRRQLVAAGVPADRVEVAAVCTRCQPDRFFSHRALGYPAGRFGAAIGLSAHA